MAGVVVVGSELFLEGCAGQRDVPWSPGKGLGRARRGRVSEEEVRGR